jgi:hypothetical protein
MFFIVWYWNWVLLKRVKIIFIIKPALFKGFVHILNVGYGKIIWQELIQAKQIFFISNMGQEIQFLKVLFRQHTAYTTKTPTEWLLKEIFFFLSLGSVICPKILSDWHGHKVRAHLLHAMGNWTRKAMPSQALHREVYGTKARRDD